MGEERWGGEVTMISRGGVEISIAGGGGELVCGLSLGCCLFFLFFVIMCYLFYVQKALCIASYEEKKTYKPNNNRPLHLIIGKIKPPETIEQTSPA